MVSPTCRRSDVIYLDFSKAFARVPHARLISKLSGYGIDGLLLKWIDDFLQTGNKEFVLEVVIPIGVM